MASLTTNAAGIFNRFEAFGPYTAGIALVAVSLFMLGPWLWRPGSSQPPSMSDKLPFVANTYQYLTDSKTFLNRASLALSSSSIVKFYLGPMTVYLVTGAQNVQSMFRTSPSVSSDKFILLIMETLHWMTKDDLARFVQDKSGRLKTPAPGTEGTPDEKRYWARNHEIYHKYMLHTRSTAKLAESYYALFSAELDQQPAGEWVTVRLYDYLKRNMCKAGTFSLCGKRLLDVNPDFIDAFWAFDEVSLQLVWGLPKWMNPGPARIRERLNLMCQRFLEEAFRDFDWNGPDADADWEPIFGSRFSREHAKWAKECGFSLRSRAGFYVTDVFGINANTIPITSWAMIELIKDSSLFHAVRLEVMGALATDPTSGQRGFDLQKLLALPLLQSVYYEAMRLHVSINITRELREPITVDGHRLAKGALLQAPTSISHLDETVWAKDGHSAKSFWAERHVKTVTITNDDGTVTESKESALAGKPTQFFPFGGGISICPGRHFAKQEIMLTIAMLVARFDIEFVEWTRSDGSVSDRPPLDDERYCGAAAVPPDRDVRIRWKRLW